MERGSRRCFSRLWAEQGGFGMLQALIASRAQDGHPENGVKEGYAGRGGCK